MERFTEEREIEAERRKGIVQTDSTLPLYAIIPLSL
jgi:hypothetical protein